ncbi:MAG TPA: zf-HC2 domain-containing protein [Myxococcota bacterium]|nr:zf-HC2 domain-containing protein [Myxococcota bacterium]
MDCKRDREEIAAYVDGELAGEARAELESHLSACAACRAEVAAQERLAHAFATLPEVTPAGDFEARFWARVAREGEARESRWKRWFGWRNILGAALVTAVALLLFLPLPERPAGDQGPLRLPLAAHAKVDPDVKIVSNPKDFELLQDPDIDAISEVDVLEDWDDNPPS